MKGEQKELEAKMRETLGSVLRRGLTRNLGKETLSIDQATTQLLTLFTQYALSCLPEEDEHDLKYWNDCRRITKENIEGTGEK